MELKYDQWHQQVINTNNKYPNGLSKSKKLSPITVEVTEEICTILRNIYSTPPRILLELVGVRNKDDDERKLPFSVADGTGNLHPLQPIVTFPVDKLELVTNTDLGHFGDYTFHFVAHIIDEENKALYSVDGLSTFSVISSLVVKTQSKKPGKSKKGAKKKSYKDSKKEKKEKES